VVVLTALGLLACGCVQEEAKHATALSAATAPVVDEATAAYESVNTIHDMQLQYVATTAFDKTDPVYNPKNAQPFLSESQIDIRLAVLKGLQAYVKDLVDITGGVESKELDTASTSLGKSLAGLGNAFLPASSSSQTATITTDGSTVTQTVVSPAAPITQGEQNLISTAINGLGQFLAYKKMKSELPATVEGMDPQIENLCKLLAKEIDILISQETLDYDTVIDAQTLFLRTTKLDAQVRREQIMKLPELARQEKDAIERLKHLKGELMNLELTHHAFAAELQHNNPSSLKSTIGSLAAAGSNLGKYYHSLPATAQ